MSKRTINFYAGPAGLPLPALERAKEELLDFAGTGMSVMEISHRSKEYDAVHEEALALTRELMGIPANYKILLLQGGAHLSFGMIPLNLLRGGRKADYIVTGNWAEKAYKEAKLVGGEERVRLAGSTKDLKFSRPAQGLRADHPPGLQLRPLHLQQHRGRHPVAGLPRDRRDPLRLRHVQRHHVAPLRRQAVRPDLRRRPEEPRPLRRHPHHRLATSSWSKCKAEDLPSYLRFKLHAEKNSLYNTPPTFGIYILRNVLAYNKSIGGLKAIEANNRRKGELLYGCIDKHAGFFKPFVTEKADRSLMNVDFFLPTEELTDTFVKEAKKDGMVGLKGYRDIGGIRVSTYNAVTVDNVKTLVDFMEAFVKKNG